MNGAEENAGELVGATFCHNGVNVSHGLEVLSAVFGWAYFFLWSSTFWAQIWWNVRKQSIVGFSFDFGMLNLVGFAAYSLYVCLLRFSGVVRDSYFANHPGLDGVIPVSDADVVFALNGSICTVIIVAQMYYYRSTIIERLPDRLREALEHVYGLRKPWAWRRPMWRWWNQRRTRVAASEPLLLGGQEAIMLDEEGLKGADSELDGADGAKARERSIIGDISRMGVSVPGALLTCIFSLLLIGSTISAGAEGGLSWNTALLVYGVGIKGSITIMKYMPQVHVNYLRKSTRGWPLSAILLDFGGGSLSLLQQAVWSSACDDWGILFGNVPKLLLSLVSMFFDVIFFVMWVKYGDRKRSVKDGVDALIDDAQAAV